jgi:excinuclease UvrABC ATPase subunit
MIGLSVITIAVNFDVIRRRDFIRETDPGSYDSHGRTGIAGLTKDYAENNNGNTGDYKALKAVLETPKHTFPERMPDQGD